MPSPRHPLPARVIGVVGVDGRARTKPRAQQAGGTAVVAVGQDDLRRAQAAELVEDIIARLHRIDADVAARIADQVAGEVVALALLVRRPGEDIWNYLLHAAFLTSPGLLIEAEAGCRPRPPSSQPEGRSTQ